MAGRVDRPAGPRPRSGARAAYGGWQFGDYKPLRDGVWELRVDHGPGYRVYYAQAGKRLVLLLAGGDRRRQQAAIETAIERWNDWQHRRMAP